ncbi:MAG: FAD:protein FMN transferase [Bacteroidetes bacterium]|nr:FAD:protein FMN transferase [Bacteroidota bacterium]
MNRRDFLRLVGVAGLLFPVARVASGWVPDVRIHGERRTLVTRQVFVMGSVFHFHLLTPDEKSAWQDLNRVVARLRFLESVWSVYLPESDLSRLNASAGTDPVTVDSSTRRLLETAKELHALSGGLFDLTVEPVMRLFGFRKDPDQLIDRPTDKELAALESAIGIGNVETKGSLAALRNGMSAVDPGGIGCGLALDESVSMLRSAGHDRAFLNFSGDVFALGSDPDENGWEVEILNPTIPDKNEILRIRDTALSTSGAYENRRGNGLVSWGHIIHPQHRRPEEPVQSVTVVAKSATMADGLSTAAFLKPDLLPVWKSSGYLTDFSILL